MVLSYNIQPSCVAGKGSNGQWSLGQQYLSLAKNRNWNGMWTSDNAFFCIYLQIIVRQMNTWSHGASCRKNEIVPV